MSKLEQIRALRESRLKSSRGGVGGHASSLPKVGGADPRKRNGPPAGVESGRRETAHKPIKRKAGRPRLEDVKKTLTATKPWAAAGMSRATWYKRQAEKQAGK